MGRGGEMYVVGCDIRKVPVYSALVTFYPADLCMWRSHSSGVSVSPLTRRSGGYCMIGQKLTSDMEFTAGQL